MTHQEANLKTKEMLSASLKKFMNKKPLSKITVSEIILDCNVNRKTFYYHFEDIYALLKWTLDQEAVEVLKQFDLLVDYEDALRFVLNYVDNNAHILNCAYDSTGIEQLKRFFHNNFQEIIRNLIIETERQNAIDIDSKSRELICDFLIEGTIGLLVNDIKNKEHYDKEYTIKNVCALIKTLPEFLIRISESE